MLLIFLKMKKVLKSVVFVDYLVALLLIKLENFPMFT